MNPLPAAFRPAAGLIAGAVRYSPAFAQRARLAVRGRAIATLTAQMGNYAGDEPLGFGRTIDAENGEAPKTVPDGSCFTAGCR